MTEETDETDEIRALILDLVAWVAARPRPYAEVMAAWRTSCPRLPVWEDAVDKGYLAREHKDGAIVRVTPLGLDFLDREGRLPRAKSH